MKEIWKDIKDYEGFYQVSNLGNIRSCDRIIHKKGQSDAFVHGKPKKQVDNGHGYLNVCLSKFGKTKIYYVHRLVAQAFIPNHENLPEVNHKDENPYNNNVENLEWCDRKYNGNYGTIKERIGKANSKQICQYDSLGNLINNYNSVYDAERKTGIKRTGIQNCLRDLSKTSGGFVWKYYGEDFSISSVYDNKCKNFIVKDIITNKEDQYSSVVKFAKDFKIGKETLLRYINTGNIYKNKLFYSI